MVRLLYSAWTRLWISLGVLVTASATVSCGGLAESGKDVRESGLGGGGNAAVAAGGSGSPGTGGTQGCGDGAPGFGSCCAVDTQSNVVLVPTPTGWIDHEDICNGIGIQGGWHAYGDQYDTPETHARCVKVGLHLPSECAQVTSPPPPPALGFPNVGGLLATTGIVEAPLPCSPGLTTSGCPASDFENMIGAGIALDFNADAQPPDSDGIRRAWDPSAYGIIGVSFVLDTPPPSLRVEFPIFLTDAEAAAAYPPITLENPTSDDHPFGSPYWGALAHGDARFPASPVVAGENVITWDQVAPPHSNSYVFDTKRLIGIHFHVPAGVAGPYAFSVEKFTFLRHL